MGKYILSCCSTADLSAEHFEQRDIRYICFHYSLDGKQYPDDLGKTIPFDKFYQAMTDGAETKTSQISTGEFISYFTPFLEEGHDILHICLSSGISGVVNSANAAKNELAEKYPDSCMLLVDTYNVLKSGIPNAIKVFDDVLKPLGKRPLGIRIDSGDITYITKKARKMLDDAGYSDCKICISNSLDEYLIRDMIFQGAQVDSYGVGERLITASSEAVFGGVYKLAAVEKKGEIIPKIKISENAAKITLPGVKIPWRLYDRETGKAIADVIALNTEKIDQSEPYEIFDPDHTWKRKVVTDFIAKKLQVKIFENGKQVYVSPSVKEIAKYRADQVDSLWDEVKRFENPHTYYVDLSEELWNLRHELLNQLS